MSNYKDANVPARIDTQRHIANVTIALLEKMPVDDINVKMIVDASQTSRTTFYRYFRDKYDVITWTYITEVDKIVAEGLCFSEITLRILRLFYEKRDFYTRAISYEQQNSLVQYISERSLEYCFNAIKETDSVDRIPREMEASVDFFLAGCEWTWKNWISKGMKDEPEFLINVIMDNMSQTLRQYFQ